MLRSHKGHKSILEVTDEVTNLMVPIPIYQSRSVETGDALIKHVVSKYNILKCMIMHQDNAFLSSLINYLCMKLGIKIKTVAPYNHQSLQVQHGIKSLSTKLTKHFTGLGCIGQNTYHLQ